MGSFQATAHFQRDLDALTDEQRHAVDDPATALCILAGAGSGKTRVLTLRVARRILDGSAEPDHTVIATFTRRAADELQHRLRHYGVPTARHPGALPSGVVPGSGVRIGTLHQLALALLRRKAADSGQPPPRLVVQRHGLLRTLVDDDNAAVALGAEIGWAKARCLTPDHYEAAAGEADRNAGLAPEAIAHGFQSYERALHRRHQIDLDDVLLHAALLIRSDSAYAESVRWRYRHLSVDEFQDVNPAQFQLITAVMGNRDDLTVVGDPNQAIYGWNGADTALMLQLPSLLPTMKVRRLNQNHRSTPQIVAAAVAALGTNSENSMATTRPPGERVTIDAFTSEIAEADAVVSALSQWSAAGRPWSHMAVLARTNSQLSVVSEQLRRSDIPFRVAPGRETSLEDFSTRSAPNPMAVELATFHRAKGLEWPAVCVIGLEVGLMPIAYAITESARSEERRLLYVALTRASEELHCSWATSRQSASGQTSKREMAPWLEAVIPLTTTAGGPTDQIPTGQRFADLRATLDH